MSKKIASEVFKNGLHNIGYVSSSFLSNFGSNEVPSGTVLNTQTLSRSMTDSQIISELGIHECTLGDVIETLDNATSEMKDGNWNLFYIKNSSRVVSVCWLADFGVWRVGDWRRGGHSWRVGVRVFSPATDSSSSDTQSFESLNLESAIKTVKEAGYVIYKPI